MTCSLHPNSPKGPPVVHQLFGDAAVVSLQRLSLTAITSWHAMCNPRVCCMHAAQCGCTCQHDEAFCVIIASQICNLSQAAGSSHILNLNEPEDQLRVQACALVCVCEKTARQLHRHLLWGVVHQPLIFTSCMVRCMLL